MLYSRTRRRSTAAATTVRHGRCYSCRAANAGGVLQICPVLECSVRRSASRVAAMFQVAPARERSVRQLSGGERRRVALGLALGFGELVSQRGRLRCNLIVLDEVRVRNATDSILANARSWALTGWCRDAAACCKFLGVEL